MTRDQDFEDWVQRARDTDILAVAQSLQIPVKRVGQDWNAPCPACNGTDGFVITPGKRVFVCRKSGAAGDVIAMVEHAQSVPFMAACEIINDEPPPRRESQARPVDPEVVRERQDERKDQELARAAAEAQKQASNADRAARIFNECLPLPGTQAEAYLQRRGIFVPAGMGDDLRYAHGLDYRGFPDADADQDTTLGQFPCMVAAIRNVDGAIIGIHRTYLHPTEPAKLVPPGDRRRNKAKKVFGSVMGGAIRLGPVRRAMAAGEGIETTLSWYRLGVGPDDVGVICAVTRGNLCGGALGHSPHPSGRGTIANGNPDPEKPGMILPPEVEEIILLGDRDADMATTNALLLTGARRHRAAGRSVCLHTPELLPGESKTDFNDLLLAQTRRAA